MDLPVVSRPGGFRDERHRFVLDKGEPELYDLAIDPSQKNNLAHKNSAQLRKYLETYNNWFKSATENIKNDRATIVSDKGVYLPLYEAVLSSGLKYKEGHGWAHDWLAVWNRPDQEFYWDIEITKAGKYSLEMDYLCKMEDIGSLISYKIGDTEKNVKIENGFEGKIKASPDRINRKEAYEIETWGKLNLGQVNIANGKTKLIIKGLKLAGNNFAEVNGVRVKYLGE